MISIKSEREIALLEKAGNMEKIIIECIRSFNGEFNKSVRDKAL